MVQENEGWRMKRSKIRAIRELSWSLSSANRGVGGQARMQEHDLARNGSGLV